MSAGESFKSFMKGLTKVYGRIFKANLGGAIGIILGVVLGIALTVGVLGGHHTDSDFGMFLFLIAVWFVVGTPVVGVVGLIIGVIVEFIVEKVRNR